ncbi:MAG: hypothetical protein MI784_06860 [Cytophagales bacterium]|nr:hypothetical protein [Cytophagales bacterium]
MEKILVGILFIGAFFLLMSIRILFVKGGKFKGTCASQNPFLNKEGEKCSYCGREPEHCKNKKPQNEVDKVLSKFD